LDARHLPVLLAESIAWLDVARGGLFVDATLGLGGHAEGILEAGATTQVLGIDRDPRALAIARERLARFGGRFECVEGNFRDLERLLGAERPVAGLLADLGVSSLQLDEGERGFSFQRDGPLDMRMGASGPSAADLVNLSTEAELTDILRQYGEEPEAKRIARGIVSAREEHPIDTTVALASVVRRAKRRNRPESRTDPATRAFQALRIAVNEELAAVGEMLDQAAQLIDRDGRLVVISYHSLEDRIVKNRLRDAARGQVDPITGRTLSETRVLEVLTRKPVRPTAGEVDANPRSRSARLRAARRL
jgi:16S rRNA (cytosine1402-N4)-methyltransferase